MDRPVGESRYQPRVSLNVCSRFASARRLASQGRMLAVAPCLSERRGPAAATPQGSNRTTAAPSAPNRKVAQQPLAPFLPRSTPPRPGYSAVTATRYQSPTGR